MTSNLYRKQKNHLKKAQIIKKSTKIHTYIGEQSRKYAIFGIFFLKIREISQKSGKRRVAEKFCTELIFKSRFRTGLEGKNTLIQRRYWLGSRGKQIIAEIRKKVGKFLTFDRNYRNSLQSCYSTIFGKKYSYNFAFVVRQAQF